VQLFVRKDQRTGVDTAKSKVILQNIRVFAVDQTVQRSPDGTEEKKVAKTVSLMLTPEQASKLSLAEQIGELSLIPRNPDDDATADGSEYTVDDLLSGTPDKNTREQEQGTVKQATPDAPAVEAVVAAAPKPVKEPFRMEVVEAQGVREVLFDGETGRVIQPSNDKDKSAAGPTLPAAAPKPAGDHASAGHSDAAKMLDDFPIKFDSDKN
jgi:Flp pilus assembly protein CpaB